VEQNKFKIFLKEETGPYELPKGWQWVKLGEVANVYYGKGLPQNQRRANGQYWAYGSNGPIYKTDFYLIEPPTIIMGRKGSIGAVTLVLDKCWPIDTTYYFKIKEKATNINYLYWYLKTIDFSKIAITTTKPGLNRDDLNSTKIPLPPLPEQKRIVARIEALFSKIDEIKRLRKEANDLAKTLMPSALHEVFSKADEKGWKWVRLGEIAFMRKQVTRPKGYPNEEFELYSIPAYHKTGYPEIRKGFEIGSSKFLVKSQDVLFGKLNPHIPKVWIVKNQTGKRQIATTEFFPIYAKNGNELLSKYLYWSLRDLRFLDSVLKLVIGTTGSRKRLQKGDFLNLEIPLPPLSEQKRIVAYLDNIQQKAQALQRLQEETEMEIERLRESILHMAHFRVSCDDTKV